MKDIRYILYIIAGVALFASCSANDDVPTESVPVSLAASVDDQIASRAAYILSSPTSAKPLDAAVWVSTTSHSYQGNIDYSAREGDTAPTTIDYHNTATFTSGSKQLLNKQMFYPASGDVYFIGLYPASGWTVSSTTDAENNTLYNKANTTFTGKEDVMFAPEVFNSISTSANYPRLKFQHLLTWLRFKIYAETEETAAAWGAVKSIKVLSNNGVSVNVSDNTSSFDNEVTMDTYLTDTDTPCTDQAMELTVNPAEVAYVLCAPVTAASGNSEYTIDVETGSRTVSVPINLVTTSLNDYIGDTAGHQFTVTLKFVQGENILTVAQVSEWDNGGISIVPVEE